MKLQFILITLVIIPLSICAEDRLIKQYWHEGVFIQHFERRSQKHGEITIINFTPQDKKLFDIRIGNRIIRIKIYQNVKDACRLYTLRLPDGSAGIYGQPKNPNAKNVQTYLFKKRLNIWQLVEQSSNKLNGDFQELLFKLLTHRQRFQLKPNKKFISSIIYRRKVLLQFDKPMHKEINKIFKLFEKHTRNKKQRKILNLIKRKKRKWSKLREAYYTRLGKYYTTDKELANLNLLYRTLQKAEESAKELTKKQLSTIKKITSRFDKAEENAYREYLNAVQKFRTLTELDKLAYKSQKRFIQLRQLQNTALSTAYARHTVTSYDLFQTVKKSLSIK